MAKTKLAIAATLAILLAACGKADVPAPAPRKQSTGVFGKKVAALPEAQRNGVFLRAIRDADGECQDIDAANYQGAKDGVPIWGVHCTGAGTWMIAFQDDGVAQVGQAVARP